MASNLQSSILTGSLSVNAASATGHVGSSRLRSAGALGQGSGKCSSAARSLVVKAAAESEDGRGGRKSTGRRELLAGTLAAGTILLPGSALGGSESGPFPPPSFAQCTQAYKLSDGKDPVDCCPPGYENSPSFIPFEPDTKIPILPRPKVHELSVEYIAKLELAYKRMRELPNDDPRSLFQQGKVHCSYCNGAFPLVASKTMATEQIHFGWYFFPFHRAELYFHERILASLIEDPTFKLPFWNWDNQSTVVNANRIPLIFQEPSSALFDPNRNANHLRDGSAPILNLDFKGTDYTNEDDVRLSNLSIMYNSVATTVSAVDFMGAKIYADGTNDLGTTTLQGGSVELGPHTAVHKWGGDPVGFPHTNEDLGNFATAGFDPLFYHLHGNVDRLWSVWENLPSDQTPTGRPVRRVKLANGKTRGDDYRTNFTDSQWLDAAFLFYNEKKELVKITVRDTLDTRNSLRYDYPVVREDQDWLNYGSVLNVANGLGDADAGAALIKDYVKDPKGAVEKLRKTPKPQGNPEDFSEFGSRASRGDKDTDTEDKPFTVRVRPEPVPAELKELDFEDLLKTLTLEEVLVPLEGSLAFSVFINLPSADASTPKSIPQFVGSYNNIPEGKIGGDVGQYRRVNVSFDVSTNLELLGIKKPSRLLITIVPEGKDTEKGVKLKGALFTLS